MKRCFVGIPLDEAARADLAEAVEVLGGGVPGLRLVAPELLHVTVKFLGGVEDGRLAGASGGMRDAAGGIGPFEVEVSGVSILPHGRRPRILAAMLDHAEPLLRLHEQLDGAMHGIGFPLDARAYNPHITLGRFKPPRPGKPGTRRKPPARSPRSVAGTSRLPAACIADLPAVETGFRADRLLLIHSELEKGGPRYTTLTSVELRGA